MDYTGKAGVGKRYLDDNGNFQPVTNLPPEVQEEIKENSKKAHKEALDKANRNPQPVVTNTATEGSSDKLLDIISKQSELISRLESKLSGDEPQVAEQKLTPKQKLQKECDELGLDYNEDHTKAQLQTMIDRESAL